MSLSFTVHGRQLLLQSYFTQDTARVDTAWWAYTLSVPTSNAAGSQLAEPDDPDYARVAIDLSSDNFASTGYGELVTITDSVFPAPSVDWGLVVGIALVDDADTGQGLAIAVGGIDEPFLVAADSDPPVISAGDVVIGLYE